MMVKKEEEEVASNEDRKLEFEHPPEEADREPSTVTSADPNESFKCLDAVVTSEQLSVETEAEDHVALAFALQRSKRRQPSGSSLLEVPSQTKESETVAKELYLAAIPDCRISPEEKPIEPPKESDVAVKSLIQSKGRPRKVKGQHVSSKAQRLVKNAGKELEEKMRVENKLEDRIRTRSCPKQANAKKARPLKGRSAIESCECYRRKCSRTSGNRRPPVFHSQRLLRRSSMHEVGKNSSSCGASVSSEPTTRSIFSIMSPDRTSGLLRTHKLLLSDAHAKLSTDNPECTSSESDLEWTRGLLSPSAKALFTPVGSGISLNSSSIKSTSLWSHLDSSLNQRWLRQAINESVEPVQSSPVEPVACSSNNIEMVFSPLTGFTTPLKKRRLTIESEGATGFCAATKLAWSDFCVQSPPELRREIVQLILGTEQNCAKQIHLSLMGYRKRMKRRRKSGVQDESLASASCPQENQTTGAEDRFEMERREISDAIQKLSSVTPVTTCTISLSLTERLRYEFGVDASDETDAHPDGEDDDEPPPPPQPPPVYLSSFRLPDTTQQPSLPPSPEPLRLQLICLLHFHHQVSCGQSWID